MAIYNKNQATVSQNQTGDFSLMSNEDDDVLSREHIICHQHQIQESWLNIIGLNRPHKPSNWSKSYSFQLNLRKNRIKHVKFSFSTSSSFIHFVN